MGDAEDTFTKQEIQAGYVTSGRDVLARQQQIMAQLQNAVGNTGRKKVGGGGPSGTGKASSNPVFPPPTYDEPLPRSSIKATQKNRLGMGATAAIASAPMAPSAASIVAGSHNPSPAAPAPHTTLTPLTPLKRTGSGVKPIGITSQDLTPAESMALQKQREEQLARQQREMSRRQSESNGIGSGKFPSSPSSSVGSGASKGELRQNGSSVGGAQIGAIGSGTIGGSSIPMGASLFGGGFSQDSNSLHFGSGHATGSGALGGQPIGQISSDETKSGVIGGISLAPSNNPFSLDSLLSGSSAQSGGGDKWGAAGGSAGQTALFANSSSFGMSSGGIWGDDESSNSQKRANHAPIGSNRNNVGSDIGGTSLFGTNSNPFGSGGGSSALASMLGIELPTGSGSLRESGLFPGQSNASQPPVGSLNNSNNAVGAIGVKSNNLLPIGAPSGSQGITIGSYNTGGGNNNDMALLQSLLPGVNITSGATPQQVGSLNQGSQLGADKWNGQQEQKRSGNIW